MKSAKSASEEVNTRLSRELHAVCAQADDKICGLVSIVDPEPRSVIARNECHLACGVQGISIAWNYGRYQDLESIRMIPTPKCFFDPDSESY